MSVSSRSVCSVVMRVNDSNSGRNPTAMPLATIDGAPDAEAMISAASRERDNPKARAAMTYAPAMIAMYAQVLERRRATRAPSEAAAPPSPG